jgi:competence ComEA-like helix-hairpin-helix protein
MPPLDRFTPAERRLAVLLASLALLGHAVRFGRGVSPEVAIWLDGGGDSVTVSGSPGERETPVAGGGRDSSGGSAPMAQTEPLSPPLDPDPPPSSGSALIDPNRAGLEALLDLPGVGPVLGRRILEDRERNGPYRRAEDLLRVAGIGPATLERLRPHLRFEEPSKRLR